ncbi:hypothetical protein ISN44_As12g022750 [Arabidopsis suecica]|uniref:Uncharacterized protein n=1 Tax=Arabidopsis suecica TaxID=45249 RepID=A0A8T1YLU8_ARASU|nr:hypothetical protein ISN44_As12g022750 [Arabidopsis suecica]
MADNALVNARANVSIVVNRFDINLVDYVEDLIEEMVDVDRLQQIHDLLENIINDLEANELLPQPPDPMDQDPELVALFDDPMDVADPVDPVADPAGPEAPAPAPDEIVIDDHDVPPGSN